MGHTNKEYTRNPAKHLNWDVRGEWKIKCEGCGRGRGDKKYFGEGTNAPKEIGDMWYIDGISIKQTSATVGPFPSNHFAIVIITAKQV